MHLLVNDLYVFLLTYVIKPTNAHVYNTAYPPCDTDPYGVNRVYINDIKQYTQFYLFLTTKILFVVNNI